MSIEVLFAIRQYGGRDLAGCRKDNRLLQRCAHGPRLLRRLERKEGRLNGQLVFLPTHVL